MMICIVPHCIYCSLLLALAVPTIIIAHEFYDALPVHQFQVCVICNIVFSFKFSMCILNGLTLQKSPRGWCEKMVDVEEDSQ